MYQFKDPYVLDFSKVESYYHMHFIIRDSFDWPQYYGCNWDAFWDLLTNMVGRPLHIEIKGMEKLENDYPEDIEKMMRVLKELIRYCEGDKDTDLRIEIYRGENKERLV